MYVSDFYHATPHRYTEQQQALLARQQQGTLAARLKQQGLVLGKATSFMTVLATAIVHKVKFPSFLLLTGQVLTYTHTHDNPWVSVSNF